MADKKTKITENIAKKSLFNKSKIPGSIFLELKNPKALAKLVIKKDSGGEMLKGKQKELDKNKDGKISGEDFKMMKKPNGAALGVLALGAAGALGAKKLMGKKKTAKAVSPVAMLDDLREEDKGNQVATGQQQAKKGKMMKANMGMEAKSTQGYGAARTQGQGLQDENLIPGKSLDYYKDIM